MWSPGSPLERVRLLPSPSRGLWHSMEVRAAATPPMGPSNQHFSASLRPAPRTPASCMQPCTIASWPCAVVWSRNKRPRCPPLSLGWPHPTRTTVTTMTFWLHQGPLEAVSQQSLPWRAQGGWFLRSPLTTCLRPKADLWVLGPDLGGWGAIQIGNLMARPLLPTGAGDEGDGQTAGST